MKVHLMDPNCDFDLTEAEPAFSEDLRRDLELGFLWDAMAGGDQFTGQVVRAAILRGCADADIVRYRQEALADCVRHAEVLDELYEISIDALSVDHGIFGMPVRNDPERELSRAVRLLTALIDRLERIRDACAAAAPSFTCQAFRALFERVAAELDDDYLRRLRSQLRELQFPGGMLMSAGVSPGGLVSGQILRRGRLENRGFFDRTPLKRPLHSFTLPERDEAGFTALAELRSRSVVRVAAAATESLDHVMGFFATLRVELAFYRGAIRLRQALEALGAPLCTPDASTDFTTQAVNLYDPCLALRTGATPVGNELAMTDSRLLVVTGANHGGKTTFLRALGVAQLMLQAGLFVAADAFAAPLVRRVLTHWTREEDEHLKHGKFDEELDRMDQIIDVAETGDLLLCNESFASTNEAEGSQIAVDVTCAMVAAGVRVRFVTHLYDFAEAVRERDLGAVFLRAPRDAAGGRSYRLESGLPLPTSFGVELYDRVFGTNLAQR